MTEIKCGYRIWDALDRASNCSNPIPCSVHPVGHCNIGQHCSYTVTGTCICLCPDCTHAKKRDR